LQSVLRGLQRGLRQTPKPGAFGTIIHDSEPVRAADFNRDGNQDVVFVAESDEVHQLFVPGRTGDVYDLMADAAGALAGTIACVAWGIISPSSRNGL